MAQQTAQVPAKRLETVKDLLMKAKPALAQALPRHMTPDRIIRVALTAITRSPLLLQCDQNSLIKAVLHAASLGLEPDGVDAHLVPFRNTKRGGIFEAQLMPDYRGLLKLAYQSDRVASAEARNVYEKDKFDLAFGLAPKFVHVPYLGEEDPGKIQLTYTIIRFREEGLEPYIEIMPFSETEKIRKQSPAGERGPWVTHDGQMRRKTCLKRALNYVPRSPRLKAAIQLDNQGEMGEPQIVDAEILDSIQEAGVEQPEIPETTNNKTEALKNKLEKEKPEAKAEAAEKPLPSAETIDGLVVSFIGYDVSNKQLEAYIGKPIDEMTREDYNGLIGIHAAIEKGDLKAWEVFPPLPKAEEEEKGKEAESEQTHVFDRK